MQVVSLQAYPCWLSGVASNCDILCWQNDVNRCSSSLYSRAGKLKLTIVIYGIITILKNLLLGFCIRQYKLTWTSKFSTDLIRWCVQLALAALHKSNDILKVFNFERSWTFDLDYYNIRVGFMFHYVFAFSLFVQ